MLGLCVAGLNIHDKNQNPVISYAVVNQIIVVDPGHGGFDPGAISANKNYEKDITLAISKKLADYLSEGGALVINLRQYDNDLAGDEFTGSIRERKRSDLAARVNIANQNKADIYVSIHTNADPCPRWSGAQTFYKKNDELGQKIAETIQEELSRILRNTNRKAKFGSYYVMDRCQMPSVIVEVGFISNPQEEKLLRNEEYQEKVAYAIYSGIVKTMVNEEADEQ